VVKLAYDLQEELENLSFVARICELWLLAYVMSKLLYMIDFSSQILSLTMVKNSDKRKNLSNKRYPVHGKHDDATYNSM